MVGRLKGSLWLAVALAASGLATGCSSIGDAVGVNKYPPDEFAVVAKAPLVIPPDYNLQPPGSNKPKPKDADPGQLALKALYPDANIQLAAPSPSESRLLQASGGSSADRTVRSDLSPTGTVVNKGAFTENLLYDNTVEGSPGTSIQRGTPDRVTTDTEEGTGVRKREKRPTMGLF